MRTDALEFQEAAVPVLTLSDTGYRLPQTELDKFSLAGAFTATAAAMEIIDRIGMETVLRWFTTTRGVLVGDKLPIGNSGLEAEFGFDPDKPNGECFFTRITVLQ